MNEQQRGREYVADLLGISPTELQESLAGIVFPAYRRAGGEMIEQLRRLEAAHGPRFARGPAADVVLRDDVPSDHATAPAFELGDGVRVGGGPAWKWWKSLRAQPHGVGMLPAELLPDRIHYAPDVQVARHERSAQRWADTQDVAVPLGQVHRLAKFLGDWTRQ